MTMSNRYTAVVQRDGKTLFDYLEDNYTLDEFLECFPSVTCEVACRVLERSESALLAHAAA